MVHIPYYTVRLLREHGYRADYLAIGRSPTWDKADYCFEGPRWGFLRPLFELWWFWTLMARYEIIHLHFLITPSATCWELPVLKSLAGRSSLTTGGARGEIVRRIWGCTRSMNICQQCDYQPQVCGIPLNGVRRDAASQYADLRLVTTPDLLHLFKLPSTFLSSPRWRRLCLIVRPDVGLNAAASKSFMRRIIPALKEPRTSSWSSIDCEHAGIPSILFFLRESAMIVCSANMRMPI